MPHFEKALEKLKDFVKTEEYHAYLLKLVEEDVQEESAKKTLLYK